MLYQIFYMVIVSLLGWGFFVCAAHIYIPFLRFQPINIFSMIWVELLWMVENNEGVTVILRFLIAGVKALLQEMLSNLVHGY